VINKLKTLYVTNRKDWRAWLDKNFDKEDDVWLVFPKKASGKPRISYNDAVEEALCFGCIDSRVKTFDKESFVQVFAFLSIVSLCLKYVQRCLDQVSSKLQ